MTLDDPRYISFYLADFRIAVIESVSIQSLLVTPTVLICLNMSQLDL